jgi:fatty acid-binding protein DegV
MSQETLVTLNNIDYLRWGRWASGWKSKFISFFNYKPLALFQGSFDNLTIMENSKSIKTNIEKMYEWCINKNKSKKIEQINIAHTYIEKETDYLKNMLLKNFEETKINIIEMSPSLGAYIGPGAIELTIN